MREEKNGPMVFFREANGIADVIGPADLIESLFGGSRLQFANALFHPSKIVGISPPDTGREP